MPGGVTAIRIPAVVALAASAVALAASPAAAGPSRVVAVDRIESPIVQGINNARRSQGMRALRVSVQLTRAATSHSNSMGSRGFFSHYSADGTSFTSRIRRFYPSRGYSSWSVGETLLWTSRRLTPARAVRRWLNSPAHRSVLLRRRWRQVGVAAVRVRNARGYYRGRNVTIVTADFGVRRR